MVFKLRQICIGLVLAAGVCQVQSAATNELPPFDEVYRLLRSNLAGVKEEDLNRAAVEGLLTQLESRVTLVTGQATTNNSLAASILSKSTIFEDSFAYLRVGKVASGLDRKLTNEFNNLSTATKLKGLVLDLRFAGGDDYATAGAVADQFLADEKPLMNWGAGSARSTAKTNAIALPVVILVNQQTTGAAEALAAVLRELQVGLLIGSPTAGQASVYKEFPLENGQHLRIALAPLKVGNGKSLPQQGLKPDIQVTATPEEEKLYFEDPFKVLPRPLAIAKVETNGVKRTAGTNGAPRRRVNEAELVRLQRDGQTLEAELAAQSGKEIKLGRPVINDPALARSLDLLKGLAVVGQARPL